MSEPKKSTALGTVAVVDEDVWLVRTLSEQLQSNGYRVMLLTSSSSALQLIDPQCDVALIGAAVSQPSATELAESLRTRLGARCPWLVAIGDDDVAGLDQRMPRTASLDEILALLGAVMAVRRPRPAPAAAAPAAG